MKFYMPMAVFGGLALIAAAIYFGSGSQPVNAQVGVQKIALCEPTGTHCASIVAFRTAPGNKYIGVSNYGN